jgi:C-5 cytosine-specific DNA methylase
MYGGGGVIPLYGGIFDDAISPALSASDRGTSRAGDSRGQDALVAKTIFAGGHTNNPLDENLVISPAVTSKWAKGSGGPAGDECQNLVVAGGFFNLCAIQERAICENPNAGPDGVGVRDDGVAFTLESRTVPQAVAFDWQSGGDVRLNISSERTSALQSHQTPAVAFQTSQSGVRESDTHATLDSNNGSRRHNGAIQKSGVRRLTPRECERLQGFPDDYTLIDPKTADGPRYKALGNSMAVPVMRWIGERIAMVDAI